MGGSAMINLLVAVAPALQTFLMKPKLTDAGVRDCYLLVDIAGYNYGYTMYEAHHKMHPDRIMLGSESMPTMLPDIWETVYKNDYVIGDFMWTAIDYLGEGGVGVIDYGKKTGAFTKPYPVISGGCGLIDLAGHKETLGHVASIIWGAETKPYIAVRPVNHSGEKTYFTGYRNTDAIDSWSFEDCEGKKAEIQVYSPGYAVELFQDGKSLGRKKLKKYRADFKTVYSNGKLEALAFDKNGTLLGRSEIRSAGADTKLSVVLDKRTLAANGEDLAFLDISITDNEGIVKTMENRRVTVTVEGAGTLQGIGSGSARPEDPYTGNTCMPYNGRLLAAVRSGFDKGEIRIKVEAEGLAAETVTVEVK